MQRLYLCGVKIAINMRLVLPGRLEGIGQFSLEIFDRLSKAHPEIEWLFIFDRNPDSRLQFAENVRCLTVFPPTRHAFLWHWWFQFSLKKLLRKEQPDLFISPDGFIPLGTKTPCISVIHDLNFLHQPKNLPPIAGAYMRHYFPQYAKAASGIVTVSNYCRQDIAESYGIEPQKIDLVYNGVNQSLRPIPIEKQEEIRLHYCDGAPYFIFVGALNPRKNIEGMLNAYSQYRDQGGKAQFILVGEEMLMNAEMQEAYRNHRYGSAIQFVGRVDDSLLNNLISSAQALCLCSHFEGFGIPILEALRCETALICADNTAMPEIAGEAAFYCKADQASSIAAAMLASDQEKERKVMIEKGKEQVKNFSWERAADMMWSSIQKHLP